MMNYTKNMKHFNKMELISLLSVTQTILNQSHLKNRNRTIKLLNKKNKKPMDFTNLLKLPQITNKAELKTFLK